LYKYTNTLSSSILFYRIVSCHAIGRFTIIMNKNAYLIINMHNAIDNISLVVYN